MFLDTTQFTIISLTCILVPPTKEGFLLLPQLNIQLHSESEILVLLFVDFSVRLCWCCNRSQIKKKVCLSR